MFCSAGGQETLPTKTIHNMGIKNVKNITGGKAEWDKIKNNINNNNSIKDLIKNNIS